MRRKTMKKIGTIHGIAGLAALGMAAALLTGCEVDTHKSGNGEDVKIATPFGGLRVKTSDAVVLDGIGSLRIPGRWR